MVDVLGLGCTANAVKVVDFRSPYRLRITTRKRKILTSDLHVDSRGRLYREPYMI